MSSGKTFQVYIPGDTIDAFQKRADKVAKGNVSGYVQKLHADEARATGAEDARRAIVALAELYHPTLARALELQLNHGADDKPVAQDRAIARLLEALHEALKRKFDPEAPFAIYSSDEEFAKLIKKRPEILRALAVAATSAEYLQGLNESAPSAVGEPVTSFVKGELSKRRRGKVAASPDADAKAKRSKIDGGRGGKAKRSRARTPGQPPPS